MKFYFHPSPNPMKVALLLEELQVQYELVPVDTFKGEQHATEYLRVNPNAKVPALEDDGVTVFDSQAILLHLAGKYARFKGTTPTEYAQMLSWLMFVGTGLSPFSGQAIHFLHHAPEQLAYAKNRYLKEVDRHYRVLDDRLAANRYLSGDEYTIADMALWGWANYASYIFGESGLNAFPNVKRVMAEISARPAAAAAHRLKETLVLKKEFDNETHRALFPHNA
jgi:GST-like protein